MRKGRVDVVQVTIDVEVVGFDVGYDSNGRRKRQKRAIVLVCFDHEQVIAFVAKISLPLGNTTTGDAGWLEAGGGQNRGGHHSGSGFSVRAGNANELAACNRLAEGLCPSGYWDPELAAANDF